jgi:hypothetical protein
MRSSVGAGFVLFTAILCAGAATGAETERLRLELRARSDTICVYEPLALCLKLTNVSRRPVAVPDGHIGLEYGNIRLSYAEENGPPADYWLLNEREGMREPVWLLAGASAFSAPYMLYNEAADEYGFRSPGVYRVKAVYRSKGVECWSPEIRVTVDEAGPKEEAALPLYVGTNSTLFLTRGWAYPSAVEAMESLVRDHGDCRYAPYALAALAEHWTSYFVEEGPEAGTMKSDYPKAKSLYQRVVDHPETPEYLKNDALREIAGITAMEHREPEQGGPEELRLELIGEGQGAVLLLAARFGAKESVPAADCEPETGRFRMQLEGRVFSRANLPPAQERVDLADGSCDLQWRVPMDDLRVVAGGRRITGIGWNWDDKSAAVYLRPDAE